MFGNLFGDDFTPDAVVGRIAGDDKYYDVTAESARGSLLYGLTRGGANAGVAQETYGLSNTEFEEFKEFFARASLRSGVEFGDDDSSRQRIRDCG